MGGHVKTMRITDDQLSALLDGQLTAEDADALEQAMASDPEIARRYVELEAAQANAADLLALKARTPMPPSILEMIEQNRCPGGAGAAADQPRPADVIRLDAARAERTAKARASAKPRYRFGGWRDGTPVWRQGAAVAACAVLAIGVVMTMPGRDRGPSPLMAVLDATGPVPPGGPMEAGLTQAVSGETLRFANGDLLVEPVMSFRTADGTLCRQVAVQGPARAADKLACRSAGGWVIDASAPRDLDSGPTQGYRTAGSAVSSVETAIDAKIASDPLSVEAERALIARGWQAMPSSGAPRTRPQSP